MPGFHRNLLACIELGDHKSSSVNHAKFFHIHPCSNPRKRKIRSDKGGAHLKYLPSVLSTFAHASGPPRTSSTSLRFISLRSKYL